jgi:4-aminobutyrate aminotransferase
VHPAVADVRGAGLMIGIELATPDGTPDAAAARQVLDLCLQDGVLVGLGGRHGNVVRVSPPLTFTAPEADRLCAVLAAAIPHPTADPERSTP